MSECDVYKRQKRLGPRAERGNGCRPRLCGIACILQTKSLFKLTLWLVGFVGDFKKKYYSHRYLFEHAWSFKINNWI